MFHVRGPQGLATRLLPRRLGAQLRCAAPGQLRQAATPAASEAPSRVLPDDGLTLADFMPPGGGGCSSAPAASTGPKRPPAVRKPKWLKMVNPNLDPVTAERYKQVRATIKQTGLATVCQEARCPNAGECWGSGTATVMIMGDTCTRGCRFCSVATSRNPPPPEPDEPQKVAHAVKQWGLDYIVLTMVDRDDLPDQGAAHICATVRELKASKVGLRVETLVGDFQGRLDLVEQVVGSGMDVFAHNIETVERLQRTVRDRRANYEQTLAVLRHALKVRPDVVTKSSIMLGLGEADEEILQTMKDLRDAGVAVVTLGQYLQPTKRHMKVSRFVEPAEFDEWKRVGEELGLHVASGPLVRSSYKAGELFEARLARRAAEAAAATGAPGGPRPVELHLALGAAEHQASQSAACT